MLKGTFLGPIAIENKTWQYWVTPKTKEIFFCGNKKGNQKL